MYTFEHKGENLMSSATMTIRLEADLKARLDKLADVTHRSKSYLAAEAVREYIKLNEWQLKEIQDAITEADAGDFASEESVNAVFEKWSVNED
jgi:predicted transcriptional regulator